MVLRDLWNRHAETDVGCARCFLFLVNYARMRTEIAVKAIPVLEHVRTGLGIPKGFFFF